MEQNTSPQMPPVTLNGHRSGEPASPVTPAPWKAPASDSPAAPEAPRVAQPTPVAPASSGEDRGQVRGLETRKAAQPHAPREAQLGVAGENDPLPPPLDKNGLPATRPVVFLSPVPPSARPTGDTARQRVIARLEQEFPVRAPELEAAFDDGVQAARTRHLDEERLAWEHVARENAEIERRNLALEARRAQIEAERDVATKDDRQRLLELDEPLAQANAAAANAVSRAHGVFDPAHAEVEPARNSMRVPLEALAGSELLPLVPSDEGWGEKTARWTDIGSGALFGTSLGLLAAFFEASSLKSLQAGTLAIWLVAMALGSVIAVEASRALAGDAARLSEARWLGLNFKGWGSPLVKLALETLAILTIWTVVDGHGIMKLVLLQAANRGGGAVNPMLTLAAGAAASVPFVAFALVRGARQGRLNGVRLRLLASQERDLRERPEVAEALQKVGEVREIERQGAMLRERIAGTVAPFEAEIAQLASLVREPRWSLSDDVQQKLRQSHDAWAKAFAEWKDDLALLTDEVEPLSQRRRPGASGQRSVRQSSPRRGLLARIGDAVKSWFRR